jgi:spore coat polysaccharide biosynthesis protein SpsF
VHRGSEDDVLGRILGAAESEHATVHVQCWGDCPFVDPGEIDRVVDALETTGADLAGNGLAKPRLLPYGLDVIAVRVAALAQAERETRSDPYHREHGTTFLYHNPERFRVVHVETPTELADASLDLTINTELDYAFVARVYEHLLPRMPAFAARDVVALLRTEATLRKPSGVPDETAGAG